MESIPCSWVGRINIWNYYSTKCNLQNQCNPQHIKLPMVFFTELEQKISQFMWKYKDLNSCSLKKEQWNWNNQPSWFQVILQSYSHQDSMVLAQKQKYRPMEQDRKPRNKSMHLWIPYFWQRKQEYALGQRQPLQ